MYPPSFFPTVYFPETYFGLMGEPVVEGEPVELERLGLYARTLSRSALFTRSAVRQGTFITRIARQAKAPEDV